MLPATDGGLWQWTSSVFKAWEGYVGSEVYPGYSSDVRIPSSLAFLLQRSTDSPTNEQFFDGKHRIVLGGSYATPRRFARPSTRNFYQANYPYMLGGGRVAYDV
jgi:formylglycine-generating enzyme required for sulfatase activity